MDELREQIEFHKSDVFTTNRAFENVKEELNHKIEQLTDSRDTVSSLQVNQQNQLVTNRKLEKRVERFKEALADSKNILEKEKSQNEQSSVKLALAQENFARSKLQVEELKRALESKTQTLRKENIELKFHNEILKKEIDDYDNNANGVISENRTLKADLTEIKSELKETCTELTILKD